MIVAYPEDGNLHEFGFEYWIDAERKPEPPNPEDEEATRRFEEEQAERER